MDYLDFDLLFERSKDKYQARLINSPAGETKVEFESPFVDEDVHDLASRKEEEIQDFGSGLFKTVFRDEMRSCLGRSLDHAKNQGKGLRIRLHFADVPELADLPWEYLYNPPLRRFFALSVKTPIVRYLELPERIEPLTVKLPLRLLVMTSNPRDCTQIDSNNEWRKMKQALDELERQGLVTLDHLDTATLQVLQRQLRWGEYHIFHFIGHGGFDKEAQDGFLVLEDETGQSHCVPGQHLGVLLNDQPSLKLVILNACQGAGASRTDPFAGTAQSLVQQGLLAVIAMQAEITDEVAILIAQEFYGAMADGYPVDAALTEARKIIFARSQNAEWGIPVLYMRSPDGCIFNLPPLTLEERKRRQQLADLYKQAMKRQAEQNWPGACSLLAQIDKLESGYRDVVTRLAQSRLMVQGKVLLEQGEWSQAADAYQQVLTVAPDLQEAKTGLAVAELMPQLEDETVAPQVVERLVHLGSNAARSLIALFKADIEAKPTAFSVLHLHSPRQRHAFTVLARMADEEAVAYLRILTPREMVFIPAGPFIMGSDLGENERPATEVWVDSFYLARCPVTNAEFKAFIEAGSYHCQRYWIAGWHWLRANYREYPWRWTDADWRDRPDHPVQWLTWYEAMAYVRWLAEQENAPYRLPTEAEWEKAASWDHKAKKKREYPWGDFFDPSRCNLGGVWTMPVGRLSPVGDSPYGVADMAGQVWEWTSSLRWSYPYTPEDGREDPKTWGERVIRGGCWANSDTTLARCACRYYSTQRIWPNMNADSSYEGPCGLRVAIGITR